MPPSAKMWCDGKTVGQVYHSGWWSIELPAGWTHRVDPECVSFRSEPSFGVLQVSAARKPDGNATLQDLYDFAKSHNKSERDFRTLNTGRYSGIFAEHISGELIWAEWLLSSGATVVYLTYNAAAALQDREMTDIRRIVESISIDG